MNIHMIPNKIALTSTQRDIYFAQLRYPANPLYNIGGFIRFKNIDPKRVQRAHAQMVRNHDAFGIRILSEESGLGQYLTKVRDTSLPIVDFSDKSESEIDLWLDKQFQTPFEIHDEPLFRSFLIKMAKRHYRYVSLAHHIAVDGWGFANLARLIGVYYNQDLAGKSAPELEISWPDIVELDKSYVSSTKYQNDKAYWQENLKDLSTEPLFSPDLNVSYEGEDCIPSRREISVLPKEKVVALKKAAAELNIAFPQLLLSAYALYWILSYRKKELTIGVPVHNRSGHKQKSKLGVFTSMSPLRLNLDGTNSFKSIAVEISSQIKRNFRHTKFPIGDIYSCISRSAQRAPLYDVAFNFLHLDSDIEIEGQTADLVYWSHSHEQTPAMLNVWEYGATDYVELQLDHSLKWLSQLAARRVLDGIVKILEQVLVNPVMSIDRLDTFGEQERALLSHLSTPSLLPNKLGQDSIISAFEHQVLQTPDKIAVLDSQHEVSFVELNIKANQYARVLQNSGVVCADIVGVSLTRDKDLPAILLAIFKLGAAYVALDPSIPEHRLASIVNDSGLKHVAVSEQVTFPRLSNYQIVELSSEKVVELNGENLNLTYSPNDLAYLIYTSGSTGIPKGVEICHKNLMALINWSLEEFSKSELRCVLASTSLSFDLSAFELFVPLSSGNCIYVVENALEAMSTCPVVSMINTVPSAMKVWLEHRNIPKSVVAINLAGEPLPMALVNDIFEQNSSQTVRNLYGPSEDTTYSTCMAYTEKVHISPAIGKVISGSCALILDQRGKELPVGHIGELYLGGSGVARGYRNLSQLTDERFLFLKASDNESMKWYRTGDLVRLDDDGILHYVGRIDEQIKLNGFRIETNEISTVLTQYPSINDALVVAKVQSEHKFLVAYYCAAQPIDNKLLFEHISKILPMYMVPQHFCFLAEFPLNKNGKIDKTKLPDIKVESLTEAFVAKNEVERMLLTLWQDLLGVQSIPIDQSLFELGGSSLLAMRMLALINETFATQFTLVQLFSHDTLPKQSTLLQQNCVKKHQVVIKRIDSNRAPLSLAQKRIWFTEQMAGNQTMNNMVISYRLSGALNVAKLRQALADVVKNNAILRTTYHLDHELPYQLVRHNASVEFVVDKLPAGDMKDVLNDLYAQRLNSKFDLESDTMLRAHLFTEDASTSYLFLSSHHIALDGYSINLLLKELSDIYDCNLSGNRRDCDLPLEAPEYGDFATWQNENKHQIDIDFWQTKLEGAPNLHGLPLDNPRLNNTRIDGRCSRTFVDDQTTKQLIKLCEQHKLTLSSILFSLYSYLLMVYSRQQDIIIGIPVLGREHTSLQKVYGVFINMLPIRVQAKHNESLVNWMSSIQSELFDALPHQSTPFEQLVEQLATAHDSSYAPIFQIMFNYQEYSFDNMTLREVCSERLVHEHSAVKYDLELHVNTMSDGLELSWLYNQAIFDSTTIKQWQNSFELLLNTFVSTPEASLHELNLLSRLDSSKLVQWNKSSRVQNAEKNFLAAIYQNFDSTSIAFVMGKDVMSYKQVGELCTHFAKSILAAGVTQGDVVGIMLPRGQVLQCSMLATMLLGVTFVPLPINFNDTRLAYIIKDSGISHIITKDEVRASKLSCSTLIQVRDIENYDLVASTTKALPIRQFHPDATAYILYTSGSTGSPKGVPIHYGALNNFLNAMLLALDLGNAKTWLALTTNSFDISLLEWLAPLIRADRCVLVSDEQAADPLLLKEYIEQHEVDVIQATPSRWRQMIESGWQGGKRLTLLTGGEALDTHLQQLLSERSGTLFNCYGPTEATIWSCINRVDSQASERCRLALGKSLSNYIHAVVDENNRLLPMGAIGELVISGVSVTNDYHNLPELSATRFFVCQQHPYQGKRFYLTGDLVRLDGSGRLNYIGRIDNQIKIRGTLVEPTEVQGALCSLPEVNQAFVCAFDNGREQELAAYLVLNEIASLVDIRNALLKILPDYLVPSRFEVFDEMPLTSNGKIDIKALPSFSRQMIVEPTLAQGKTQKILVSLWCSELDGINKNVCVETDFYSLGGNSMHVVRLVRKINQHFDFIEFSVADFLADSRITTIASLLDERTFYQNLTSDASEYSSITVI
ncbi:non-ribosomal peptide synthetase [Pseudoalteromonas maricaloris]|uniref:Amino acid adenylation domain-containing protein n=1 Tax=Pseudoalteromonas maricaloris TaxID=184924 RepID=A0A8I2GY83_9GAMM|nr:non-ribosomal peptide synthetase [Pseudoalteromonas maricaloris]NLR20847.1 amino acid adenylation domain-containing protein [Pseudoalteromonas maricaloris]WOX30910.1 non-ribosomal peptide synthetase [Pseudoalteromonas maricaloris]